MNQPQRVSLSVTAHRLEGAFYTGERGKPCLVLLHEGLGSVALWRDFPERLVSATGCSVFLYSRYGYGESTPNSVYKTDARYMHREALDVLPLVLRRMGIHNPILIGHSDGGSIALIYAGGTAFPIAGLVTLAAHVFVEPICIAAIEAARGSYATSGLREKLSRYHADPDGAFQLWSQAWLSDGFRQWNLERYLPSVTAPVLVLQGDQDAYGTEAQVTTIAQGIQSGGNKRVNTHILPRCGHSPHRDRCDAVLDLIAGFVRATSTP